jgi:hypothetical protein
MKLRGRPLVMRRQCLPTHFPWADAFCKFGFDDGDGDVRTEEVAYAVEQHGYETVMGFWGCHNFMINDILKDGQSILFDSKDDWLPSFQERELEAFGYECPTNYLPPELVSSLDKQFGRSRL